MSFHGKVPDVLPFTKADLRLPMAIRKGQRNSISGVQAKVLLSIVDGEFNNVSHGRKCGQYCGMEVVADGMGD